MKTIMGLLTLDAIMKQYDFQPSCAKKADWSLISLVSENF